jgi:hypothetical protein
MRRLIHSGLEFRRIANASPEMIEIVHKMEDALRMAPTSANQSNRCGFCTAQIPASLQATMFAPNPPHIAILRQEPWSASEHSDNEHLFAGLADSHRHTATLTV